MINCQKGLFSLPEDIHYLNCAYMAPLMRSVEEAGILGVKAKSNPTIISPNDFFAQSEEVRKVFSRLINNPKPEQVAIVPSVSYGMANVANNIQFSKNDHIIVVGHQFPSNYYQWRELAEELGIQLITIYPPEGLENRGKLWNEDILRHINQNTRLVAMPHVHWADGTKFNLKAIREKLDGHDGLLVIDGTQSVGALLFDVQDIRPDALICAGYKWLMGPYSIGVAYYGEKFNNGKPVEQNWISRKNSQDFANLINYQTEYQPGALRYDVGERSNFILVPMLLEALKQIEKWGINSVQEYCGGLLKENTNVLKDNGFFIEDLEYRGNHLFGIYLPEGIEPGVVKSALEKQNIYVSIRGSSVRVSPHVYNTKEDIDALAQVLIGLV